MVLEKAKIDLHVHPFLDRYSITDVVGAMEETGTDVVALEALDASLHPRVVYEVLKAYPDSLQDRAGIRLPNGRYIFNGREYNTREKLHLLTVGYSVDKADRDTPIIDVIDDAIEHGALVIIDHPFVDNVHTRTAGHISAELEGIIEGVSKTYSGKVALEWNGYCIPWIRAVLRGILTLGFYGVDYHDVNLKVEQFSGSMLESGYNVPVLADTDLHARSRSDLYVMGTAHFTTKLEGDSPKEVLESMKSSIFRRQYENVKEYVGAWHLLGAFCLPVLFPGLFKKPRA